MTSVPTNVRWLIFALSCGASFLLYLHRYTWGFIKLDIQREFGWDPKTLGLMDSFFLVTYAGGQIPSGMLCDWFGAHALLGTSIVCWSLGLLGVVVATGAVSMACARLAFGAGQAACYPVLNKVSKNWFPLATRTTAQGWIASFFGRGGGAMAYLLFGTVLLGWLELPWRWALFVLTLAGLAFGVVFILLFRNAPREHPWANEAEAELVTAGDPLAAQASHSHLRWTAIVTSPNVWFIFFYAVMANLADVIFVYWVPLYLRTVKEVQVTSAGWMAALPLVGGAVGGATSGWFQSYLIRRTGSRRWARRAAGATGYLCAALAMWASLSMDAALAVMCIFLVAKFFSDWSQPAVWGTTSDIGGRNAATVFAWINTVGAIAGIVAGPLIGWILEYYSGGKEPTLEGWNALFLIVGLEYLAAASVWLLIDCTKVLDEPEPTV